MDLGSSQIDRTLHLLNKRLCATTTQDTQLLQDLRTQLSLYCANLDEGGANSEVSNNINKALSFLSNNLITNCSSSPTLLPLTTTHTDNSKHEQHDTGITSSVINGSLVYFLDGKQIRFKVLKNKPKNGDFKVRWNRSYEALRDFQAKYGTTRVTRSTPGYRELGNWVAEQRRKLKTGKITQRQFEVLNELGMQ